jgi:hypothetical protein
MKRSQLSVQTFIIDDTYDLGDVRIFWNDFGSKWWQWKFSPDGDVSGSWFWVQWFTPPVTMWNPADIEPRPANPQWCMALIKTLYASADDAILNPTNVIRQPYTVLYGGWEYKAGKTEPETPWFDNVDSSPPEANDRLAYGRSTGSGIGLFAEKSVTRMNPITRQEEGWILPPSSPRRIFWDTTDWLEPDDPYNQLDMDYEMLKRRGWYKKDPSEHIPPGWNPKPINFGKPQPSPAHVPKTAPSLPSVAPRRKT